MREEKKWRVRREGRRGGGGKEEGRKGGEDAKSEFHCPFPSPFPPIHPFWGKITNFTQPIGNQWLFDYSISLQMIIFMESKPFQ